MTLLGWPVAVRDKRRLSRSAMGHVQNVSYTKLTAARFGSKVS